jgi:dTDP-glucose 4,6-dehydratase
VARVRASGFGPAPFFCGRAPNSGLVRSIVAVVTGGAGFLGSHLCDHLLAVDLPAERWRVVCVDNMSTGSASNVAHLAGDDRFTLVHHDVAEPFPAALQELQVDVVFHLASPASPWRYLHFPLETLRACMFGTFNALEYAAGRRARFVFASSSEVYGDPLVVPQHEFYWGNCNPAGPRSVYGEGKRYGEAMTTTFRFEGLDTAIARPFNVYGPRLQPDDGRVVPAFLSAALAGEPLVVYGGDQTRSFCYVDDAVRGLHLLATSRQVEPVNIGNPEEISMRELAETVVRVTGSTSEVTFAEPLGDDPRRRVPDVTRAWVDLGWRPTVGLEEGLRRTAEAFRV